MFESSSKNRKSWIENRWFGNAFQILGATDENEVGSCHGGFTWRNAY